MTTTIKITELSDIGANLASSTILPVVNMGGVPVTQKTTLGNIANVVLGGAGIDYVSVATAVTVSSSAQPNITAVGDMVGLTVSNASGVVNFVNTSNVALGAVGRVHITGGANGQVLTTNGSGNLSWTTVSGGGANTGNITFTGDEISSTNDIVNILGNDYAQLQSNDTYMWVEDGGANIAVNGNAWTFNNQGYMQIPNDGFFGALNSSVLGFSSRNDLPIFIEVIDTGNNSAKQWVFDNTGNLTLPGNTFAVKYANNTSVIIPTVGNISTINLTGSNSNVLYGNGVFAAIPGGANTGNVTFDDVTIIGDGNLYLQPNPANADAYLDVYLTTGPDIHIASNGENLILGRDSGANIMVGANGNVTIRADDGGASTWTFDTNAQLNLPGGTGYLSSSANTITIYSDADEYNGMLFYDGGVDVYASEDFSVFANNSGSGTTWRFYGNGGTLFPTLTTERGDVTSGTITGQTLLFGDNSTEAIITTPNGDANVDSNSQRLVINPGAGADGSNGEGGDIYLWAGRGGSASGSGGDIKIRGGQGGASTDGGSGGDGGYIRVEAGSGATGNGGAGYIEMTGGEGYGTSEGGYVRITAGPGGNNGGYANLIGGYAYNGEGGNVNIVGGGSNDGLTHYGNVNIGSGASTWIFDNSGNLNTPGNIVGPANANLIIYANAGVHDFVFGDDGTFYAPDNVVLGGNSIYIGPGANTLAGTEHAVLIASSNHFAYIQAVLNNVSDNGSADWVAQGHHGTDEGGWADMGFTSAGFNDANYTMTGGGDGYVFVESFTAGQIIAGSRGGNLVLATGDNGTVRDIIFGTGGFSTANIFGRISDANNAFEISRAGASLSVTGNISGGNILTGGTVTATGNGTFGNISTTGSGGNITGANVITANTLTANNFTGNGGGLSNVATKISSSWTLANGVNTVSINVPLNGTYSLWINGNIPNGIVTYTATAVVTNTNVPVLGSQYAWYYELGNALVFTSIPDQFIGTAGSISNVNTYGGNTANVFTFGITNNSGSAQVVNYGYTKL